MLARLKEGRGGGREISRAAGYLNRLSEYVARQDALRR